MHKSLLHINNLSIARSEDTPALVRGINLSLNKGEVLAIVGESGSGKTLTTLAITGLLPDTLKISTGNVFFEGKQIAPDRPREAEVLRGRAIAMVFQDASTALHPTMTCGAQIEESVKIVGQDGDAKARTMELLKEVQLLDNERIYKAYPHELSGGQRQRVMIAMALGGKPKLLIADEPTTALDPSVRWEIVHLLDDLRRRHGMALLFVSHDLQLVAKIANHIAVYKDGECVEYGEAAQILTRAAHPYTRALLACHPSIEQRLVRIPTLSDYAHNTDYQPIALELKATNEGGLEDIKPPILELSNIAYGYEQKRAWWQKAEKLATLQSINLAVHERKIVGIVGASGSGKSTLASIIIGLLVPSSGTIAWQGKNIPLPIKDRLLALKQSIQFIFQDSASALNPLLSIGETLREVIALHQGKVNVELHMDGLLQNVGLDIGIAQKYPNACSGGQLQRVCIARALAVQPRLLICDEIVSSLDVSIQAEIVNLLLDLRDREGLSILFISHDMRVVRQIADTVIVLDGGKIVEQGINDEFFASQQTETARSMLKNL